MKKLICKLFGHKVTSTKEKRVKNLPMELTVDGNVFYTSVNIKGTYRYFNHCSRCGEWNISYKKGTLCS
jgi:hypothetical protein